MIEALIDGLVQIVQWPTFGFLVVGCFLGIWLGAIPGLNGLIGMVIVLPFTFDMQPVPAFALLLSLFAVTSTGDTIASVMLGIPGTAASQATILDGYPLAMKGQAARAFGAAFTVSALGGVIGGIVLAVSLPVITPVIMAFGSPEFFMLALLGLTMVGSLSGASISKGLMAAAIGLIMAQVGYGEIQPIPRFTFNIEYLLDGLPLLPVVLGLFAIPEVMELAIKDTSISRVPREQVETGGMRQGIMDALKNWWLVIRCSAIGVYIGMLPGLGASIVDWIAYGHTVQSAKDKSMFGHGDIRGVIGPESANNAVRGGSMIPTVAFGIPGSAGNAILLSALLIQGLKPGTEMLTDHLDLTFSMVWTLLIANVLASGMLMLWTRQIAKVAFVRGHLVLPVVILFVFMGAWMSSSDLGDWVALILFGLIGTVMKRSGWPRPPVILAIVLGPIMEQAYQVSIQAFGSDFVIKRPVSIGIAILIIITLVFSYRRLIGEKKTGKEKPAGDAQEKNPLVSTVFSSIWFLLFPLAAYAAVDWPRSVRQFPIVVSLPAAAIMVYVLIRDVLAVRTQMRHVGGFGKLVSEAAEQMMFAKTALFFCCLAAIVLVAVGVGQLIALPLFMGLYVLLWGRYNWKIAAAYSVGGFFVLYFFYDRLLHVFWYPAWIHP